jgi:hypothetical protein
MFNRKNITRERGRKERDPRRGKEIVLIIGFGFWFQYGFLLFFLPFYIKVIRKKIDAKKE